MIDKKSLERIVKYSFFGTQIILFACVTLYFFNAGKGFGIHTFFWFALLSMPLCIIFGIISIMIEKKFKK